MATFQKADKYVIDMAQEIIEKFESHHPLSLRGVKIDYLFAFGERDEETGQLKSCAIKHNGMQALGLARKISLKDRAKGMGDAEITLDHDNWEQMDEKEQEALLDHELHHIVATDKNDDLGRPIIKLRKHDFEVGWFQVIAIRHGASSMERKQAKTVFDRMGQSFWPGLTQEHHDRAEASARVTRSATASL